MACPDWSADATPAEETLILAGVFRVHESTLRTAKVNTPDHGTLKTWHKILFEKVVPLWYYAGHFRGLDPRYECLQGFAHIDGKFGFPPNLVAESMRLLGSNLRINDRELNQYLKRELRTEYQTVAKIMMVAGVVGTFIQIHPFANGNGRTSRLLANHLCHRYGLEMPFINPSRRPPNAAYALAGRAAMDGDFKPLFQYILDAVHGRLP